MHRSHLVRWLALVVGVFSFQCLDDLSDNCEKTRTCGPAPQLGNDCVWRYPDGRVWNDGPRKAENGLWVWPDGKLTKTQGLDCGRGDAGAGFLGDAGLGAGTSDNCPTIACDNGLFCHEDSQRCVKCLDNEACKGTADLNRGQTPICDARIHDCVACSSDPDCGEGLHCKTDANPINNRCVACTSKNHCSGDDVCDSGTNECTSVCTGPGQCKAPKPICSSPTAGLCVGCIGNGDCSGNTSQCNTTRKECVQCVDNAPCLALGQVCGAGNRCVECADDSTCRDETRPHCDVVTGSCVPCLDSSQCTAPGSSRCNALHQCTACTDSSQCEGTANICNTTTGQCVACIDDSTCIPGVSVCDTANGTCVGCGRNEDCGDSSQARCDVPSHTCVQCTSPTQCAGRFGPRNLCNNGDCVECIGNGQCTVDPNKSRCDATGLCAGCRVDGDCSAITDKHACTGGNNGRCVECLDNQDCIGNPRGLACNTGTNTCVPCVVDTDCKTPDASRCLANQCVRCVNDPASGNTPANSHCGHIVSGARTLAICDTSAGANAGVCVECTGNQRAACGANVCNSLTKVCSTFPVGSANTCLDCVSDAHCSAGDRCVLETFGGMNVGYSCFPLKPTGACQGVPYAAQASLTTIDGAQADVCMLRRTTCAGVNQFGTQPCTTDAQCGEAGLDDAVCDTDLGRCSVPCSSVVDCPTELSTCSSGSVCLL